MFFAWDITIAANTAEASPITQLLKLTKGVLTKVVVKFPAGCHGLAKVRLYRYESQLFPLNPGEWITGDDESVPAETYYELEEVPVQLKFVGVNEDDTYPHTVTVRITILPKAVATLMPIMSFIEKLARRIFGE